MELEATKEEGEELPMIAKKRCPLCRGRTYYLYQRRPKDRIGWAIVGVRCPKCNWVETEKGFKVGEDFYEKWRS